MVRNADVKSETDLAPIDETMHAKIKSALDDVEKLTQGIVTVTVRWFMLNITKATSADILREFARSWMARPPQFSEVVFFLRGAIELQETTVFGTSQLAIMMGELDRVDEGIPVRFQQLYFELSGVPSTKTIDLDIVKTAFKQGSLTFPPLTIPKTDEVTTDTTEEGKASSSSATPNEEDAATPKQPPPKSKKVKKSAKNDAVPDVSDAATVDAEIVL